MAKFPLVALSSTLVAFGSAGTSRIGTVRHSSSSHRNLDVEIDGSYSIKFSQCVEVKLRNDNPFDDDASSYEKDGQIISSKSFVLFHICQSSDCYYESEDDLYIVDLATYLQNAAQYHATAKNNYCQACTDYYDYCTADDDDTAADDAVEEGASDDAADEVGESEEDGGNEMDGDDAAQTNNERQLMTQRRTKNIIDCGRCMSYNCYTASTDDSKQNQEDIDSNLSDMIGELAGCLSSGQYLNEQQLYLSAMCSSGGGGVELAVFLDNKCTVYTNKTTFSSVYNDYIYMSNEQDLFGYAEIYIKSAFEEAMPCLSLEFDDPDAAGGDDNAYLGEASEFCQAIIDAGAVDFNNCYSNSSQFGNNYNDDDVIEWERYDMTYDEADELQDVCSVVYEMSGEYYYSYDAESSGTWYASRHSESITSRRSFHFGLSSTDISIISLLGVSMAVAAAIVSYRRKKARSMEPLYQGGAMI